MIVPPAGRQSVLTFLHEDHLGISRMKSLVRSFVWWPQIDKDLEDVVKSCQQTHHAPPLSPLLQCSLRIHRAPAQFTTPNF